MILRNNLVSDFSKFHVIYFQVRARSKLWKAFELLDDNPGWFQLSSQSKKKDTTQQINHQFTLHHWVEDLGERIPSVLEVTL